jgi:hypothetical protein
MTRPRPQVRVLRFKTQWREEFAIYRIPLFSYTLQKSGLHSSQFLARAITWMKCEGKRLLKLKDVYQLQSNSSLWVEGQAFQEEV